MFSMTNDSRVGFKRYLHLKENVYRLVAVIYHQGQNALQGHYICFVQDELQEWKKCNDGLITACTFAEVEKENPSVLVYLKSDAVSILV